MRHALGIMLFLISVIGYAQEDCINGIDDDNDGLIDANDPDCLCCRIKFEDYIENGDFSNYVCCAINVNCFAYWDQAQATSDIWHNCLGSIPVNVPMPMPAEGIVGSRSHGTEPEGFYQCLEDCLLANTQYVLSFDYYSADLLTDMPVGNNDVGMEIYGVPTCEGVFSADLNCPISGDIDLIHSQVLPTTPSFTWNKEFVSFTPLRSYEALLFISGCGGVLKYNYITNISVKTTETPTSLFAPDPLFTGNPCIGVDFEISNVPGGVTIQWYIDGVAVVGEDQQNFHLPPFTYGEVTYGLFSLRTCAYSDPILIEPLPEIDLNATIINSPCFMANGGSISSFPLNGQPLYQFMWSNGSNTNSINKLAPGVYSLTVTDRNGCTSSDEYMITEPGKLTGTITSTTFVDPIIGLGSATAQGDGGTPAYSYHWSSGEFGPSAINLPAGTNYVTITDENGCEEVLEVEMMNAPLTFEIVSQKVKVCKDSCSGFLEIKPDGALPPYTIIWDDEHLQGFEVEDLCSGTYKFTIYDSSIEFLEGEVTISEYDKIKLEAELINPSCLDSLGGKINTTIISGKGPFLYQWSNGSNNDSINLLKNGGYHLTIFDDNSCQLDTLFELFNEFDLDPVVKVLPGICPMDSNGSASVILPDFTYYSILWEDGNADFDRNGLPVGKIEYTIIEDTSGCEYKSFINVPIVPEISFPFVGVDTICQEESNGILQIDTTNFNSKKYTFKWEDGSTSPVRDGLSAGTYQVEVISDDGCLKLETMEVIEFDLSDIETITRDPSCDNGNDGYIKINNQGIAIDKIIWTNGMTGDSIFGLISGEYSASITDVNKCIYIDTFTLSEVLPIDFELELHSETCHGDQDGFAQVVPQNGTLFSVNWSNGTVGTTTTDLSPGAYMVTIVDQNACTTVDNFNISEGNKIEYTALVLDETCSGLEDGIIHLESENTYQYIWDPIPLNVEKIEGLKPGKYAVKIIDSVGCETIDSFEILNGRTLKINALIDTIYCQQDLGNIYVQIQDSVGIYNVEWSNGNTELDLLDIYAGEYHITIEDEYGCFLTDTFTMESGFEFDYTIDQMDTICPKSNDGYLAIQANSSYQYLWSNGSIDSQISNLEYGSYQVTITDENQQCQNVESFAIDTFEFKDFQVEVKDVSCFGEKDGSLMIYLANGSSVKDFYLNSIPSTPSSLLESGMYSIEFADENGCARDTFIEITEPDELIAEVEVDELSCFDSNDGEILLNIDGGTGNYSYSWSTGDQSQTLSGLESGRYFVTVTDTNDCNLFLDTSIVEFETISVHATVENVLCDDPESGQIVLVIENDFQPNFYLNSNGPYPETVFKDLSVGNYDVAYFYNSKCIQFLDSYKVGSSVPQIDVEIKSVQPNAYEFGTTGLIEIDYQGTSNIVNSFVWANDELICNSIDIYDCIEIEHLFVQENKFIVTAIDENNCVVSDTLLYKAVRTTDPLHIPNVFSPSNRDGQNDFWDVEVPPFYKIRSAVIFDRWGNKVFFSDLPNDLIWDGKMNGRFLQNGVYVYMIEILDEYDGRILQVAGDVTILD